MRRRLLTILLALAAAAILIPFPSRAGLRAAPFDEKLTAEEERETVRLARDERFQHFRPWVTICEKECYGLPTGARLITINVPSFQLQAARLGDDFKIVSAMPYID